jgi:putative ABC transport system substrate-binding protein
MKRREFIALIGSATVLPLAARAQQPTQQRPTPVVGVVRIGKADDGPQLADAFRRGLIETGLVEDQNVAIVWRWAEGNYERLPDLIADLVARRVAVIVTPGATATALAAKTATQSIPIVFMVGVDPVEFGLVASLRHPGGNITGVAQLQTPVVAKRFDILHQLIPDASSFGLLTNPANPFGEVERREAEIAAQTLGLKLRVAGVKNQSEIDAAFPALIALGARAIMIGGDTNFTNHFDQIAALAAQYGIPTIAQFREYPASGGLISYGNNVREAYHLTGVYVARILKGEKPADMPVQQPTKFELVINVRTAKALAFAIPDKLLAVADEVIE